jgi:hypothetical protein
MAPGVVWVEAAPIDMNNREDPAIAAHDSRAEPAVCGQAPLATMVAIADVGANVGNLEPRKVLRAEEARVPHKRLIEIEEPARLVRPSKSGKRAGEQAERQPNGQFPNSCPPMTLGPEKDYSASSPWSSATPACAPPDSSAFMPGNYGETQSSHSEWPHMMHASTGGRERRVFNRTPPAKRPSPSGKSRLMRSGFTFATSASSRGLGRSSMAAMARSTADSCRFLGFGFLIIVCRFLSGTGLRRIRTVRIGSGSGLPDRRRRDSTG